MKNSKIEEEIVRKYIKKERQERLLWEFNNPKKRDAVFWHFSGPGCFKKECLNLLDYMSSDSMLKYLQHLSGAGDAYFIGESYIGDLSLEKAVAKAQDGEICIIYCGNGIAYYQGEEDRKPPRFLLQNKQTE